MSNATAQGCRSALLTALADQRRHIQALSLRRCLAAQGGQTFAPSAVLVGRARYVAVATGSQSASSGPWSRDELHDRR